ncbi:DedA family protein [Paenibacillus pini]|uniref:DedA family protein n=1 Tax=Paenibacillus pini TaxID=669461 RepID=UPI000A5D9E68
MAVSGHLSTIGNFNILHIIFFSYIGAIIGTTITYYIGFKLGTPFFEKYGKYFFMNQNRITKITIWFDTYGTKLIFVSYFIPGLRHFTGYVSGILQVQKRIFFIYNCIGGMLWVIVYVSIGRIFGTKIEHLLHIISQYSFTAIIILTVGCIIVFLIRRNKEAIYKRIRKLYR